VAWPCYLMARPNRYFMLLNGMVKDLVTVRLKPNGFPTSRRSPEEFPDEISPLTSELEAHLEKLCNVIDLPPMLCVFMVLGVCVGLAGIVRTVSHTSLTTAIAVGTR
jgi:hypothetical protein